MTIDENVISIEWRVLSLVMMLLCECAFIQVLESVGARGMNNSKRKEIKYMSYSNSQAKSPLASTHLNNSLAVGCSNYISSGPPADC